MHSVVLVFLSLFLQWWTPDTLLPLLGNWVLLYWFNHPQCLLMLSWQKECWFCPCWPLCETAFHILCILWPSIKMSEPDSSSVFSGSMENGTFLELFPTSLSTSVDPSSGHLSNVYIYVSIFLSLLAFLLLLLIIALQRLKNIISSSSSYPEYPSDAGSSFTNLEVCSISSQRSTFSNLSSWRKCKNPSMLRPSGSFPSGSVTWSTCLRKETPILFSSTD